MAEGMLGCQNQMAIRASDDHSASNFAAGITLLCLSKYFH